MVRFSSRSRSLAALRLATAEAAAAAAAGDVTEVGTSTEAEQVLKSDCEWGEKLPLGVGGEERRPPGPHLDNGLLKRRETLDSSFATIAAWVGCAARSSLLCKRESQLTNFRVRQQTCDGGGPENMQNWCQVFLCSCADPQPHLVT